MSNRRTFVIVGGGLAGASAAATLRADGFDGRVVLVGAEQEEPYHRPPLSKEYLRGERRSRRCASTSRRSIATRRSSCASAHRRGARARARARWCSTDGERIAFDAALLATGAEPRALTLPGAELAGVHYLRTHADSDSLSAALQGATRIAMIGGGWIACEVAASARQLGVEVTLVAQTRLLAREVLGASRRVLPRRPRRARRRPAHGERGHAASRESGRVERVVLADGDTIECDLVSQASE